MYSDNDVSAYKRHVRRPAFEQLIRDLTDGTVGGVVVYDLDRFARQPRDLERVIDIIETRRLTFATVQGDIDLESSDERTMARVMVAFANKSSADTSRRVARKHLELAEKGIPVGTRAFGWNPDKKSIHPTEAAQIRQAVADVLAGKSLGTVTDEWNKSGSHTSRGNPWQRQTVRQMLVSPRLVGHRVHRRAVLRDPDGKPVRGLWEPILDVETWERLQDRLVSKETVNGARPGGRRYLLSGIARCGKCSTLLRGNADRAKGFSMACPPSNQGGCGAVAISGPRLDALIEALILAHLGSKTTTVSPDVHGEEELTEKSRRITELMAAYAEGTLSGSTVFPTVKTLEADVHALRTMQRERRAVARSTMTAPEAWPNLDTDQRREIVSAYLSAVAVRPAKAKGGRFDPERVEPVWR